MRRISISNLPSLWLEGLFSVFFSLNRLNFEFWSDVFGWIWYVVPLVSFVEQIHVYGERNWDKDFKGHVFAPTRVAVASSAVLHASVMPFLRYLQCFDIGKLYALSLLQGKIVTICGVGKHPWPDLWDTET